MFEQLVEVGQGREGKEEKGRKGTACMTGA